MDPGGIKPAPSERLEIGSPENAGHDKEDADEHRAA